jgi:signal transduction histidine kinase
MTKCNFEEYCDGIINELTDYYKDININKCYQYIFGNILIDTKILRHVILNLLSNAIKYSPLNSEIKFITNKDKDNDNIILYIEDKGIGIPENDINMIFEPFHRANNVKNIEGTGLGMSIVKRSLDLCKGKISISSKVNEGTNITLTIPYEKI